MLVLCYTFFFFFDWSPTRLAKSGWITSHYLIKLTVNLKYCCDLNEVADQTLDSSMLPCVKTPFCNIWIQGIKYIVKKKFYIFKFRILWFCKNTVPFVYIVCLVSRFMWLTAVLKFSNMTDNPEMINHLQPAFILRIAVTVASMHAKGAGVTYINYKAEMETWRKACSSNTYLASTLP